MQDPQSIVLCSAISEVFLRRLAKQEYIKYVEGSEFVDSREDLIEMGDPTGGGSQPSRSKKLAVRVGGDLKHFRLTAMVGNGLSGI